MPDYCCPSTSEEQALEVLNCLREVLNCLRKIREFDNCQTLVRTEKEMGRTEMTNNNVREIEVSDEGLKAFVKDMTSLLNTKRTVEKVAKDTGRYYVVSEDIPAEELFTLVAIRVDKDGKFVVQAANSDLEKLNKKTAQEAQVTRYESL